VFLARESIPKSLELFLVPLDSPIIISWQDLLEYVPQGFCILFASFEERLEF
jgi:hypothetical protein